MHKLHTVVDSLPHDIIHVPCARLAEFFPFELGFFLIVGLRFDRFAGIAVEYETESAIALLLIVVW